MFVLHRNPAVVGDCIVGEASHLGETRVRRYQGNIVKGSVSVTSIERVADILIEVVVGDEEGVTMIARIRNNQGVRWGDLALKLQAVFQISRAFEGVRSGHVIGWGEGYVLRREGRRNLIERS